MLHASIFHGQVKQAELDHALSVYKQSVLPVLKTQAGFIRSILLCNLDTHQFIAIFFWEGKVELLVGEASAYLQAQLLEIKPLLNGQLAIVYYAVYVQD